MRLGSISPIAVTVLCIAQSLFSPAPAHGETAETKQLRSEVQRLRMELQKLRQDFVRFQDAVAEKQRPDERFTITGFAVSGNTAVDTDTLNTALAPLTDKKLTLESLQGKVKDLIKESYGGAGVRGIQVVIPQQQITEAPIKVEVIEPTVESFSIKEGRWFKEANVGRFFKDFGEKGSVLIAQDLEDRLEKANEHPDRQITAVLGAGEEAGGTDVALQVNERKVWHGVSPLHLSSRGDNSGTPNVGRHRITTTLQYTNFFGSDSTGAVQWLFNPSSFDRVQVVGASYNIPFGPSPWSLGFFGGYSAVETEAVVDTLEILGEGFSVGGQVGYEFPQFWGLDTNLSLGVEWSELNNVLEFGTFTVIRSEVGRLPVFLRYNIRNRDAFGSTLANVSFRYNVGSVVKNGDTVDFQKFRAESNSHFWSTRFGLGRMQKLWGGWTLGLNFAGQYTDSSLIPAEQFRLGGATSVRGYEQSEISGDRAILTRSEIRSPAFPGRILSLFTANKQEMAQFVAFIDYGLSRLDSPITGDPVTTDVGGTGFGLRYQLWGHFLGEVDFAWALLDGSITQARDSVIHFSIQMDF